MATAEGTSSAIAEPRVDKGLKAGALGLVSTTVMGVASTAPAYSLAATLGFIVVVVGLGAPIVAVLAFIPIFLTSIGYSELNKADPDCGTTFTWATRAFGPRTAHGLRGRAHPLQRLRPGARPLSPASARPGSRLRRASDPA